MTKVKEQNAMNVNNSNINKCYNCQNVSTFLRFNISAFFRFMFFLFTVHCLLFTASLAQVNFEPVNNSVYSFLERMSIKGIIQLNEEIKPFSRKYIAEKLLEVKSKRVKVKSNIEKEELKFYIREFSAELKKLGMDLSEYEAKDKLIDLKSDKFGFDKYNRFRLISYDTDEFGLFIDPIFRIDFAQNDKNLSTLWSNGLRLYGNISNSVAFDLQFYDNHAKGNYFNSDRKFSHSTGYEFNVGKNGGIDFDRMNANLTYSWSWGSLTLGKDFNYYGTGENGKIILSDKAPSFPFIKLEANPTKWFKFSYIHGALNSQVIDSSGIRLGFSRDHFPKITKYFVGHLFSFTPLSFFNISLGESVIYSDRFEPIYLIPVAFFRLADHYLTDPDESAGNAQLFGSFWLKSYKLRTKLYGSIFIDELSLGNADNPQAIAYNLGFKTIDPFIPKSEFVFEYSKILPFVYFHSDKAQTYQNYGYDLGHWIGSNTDEIYIAFQKRIIRGLNINIWYSYIRKSNEERFDELRYQKDQTFLWGNVNKITMYGTSINYELIHSLNINATYEYSNSVGGNNYLTNPGSLVKLALNYGL